MPVLFAKPIVPKALKVDAMRVALLAEMRKVAKDVHADFNKTTDSWTGSKPVFGEDLSLTQANGPAIFVGLREDGSEGADKYVWVSGGTRPHDIQAGIVTGKSTKKALSFPGTFTAKTMPGVIGSSAGGHGGATFARRSVHHPGTKARKFDQAIRRKWQPLFTMRMQLAMRAAAKASGHAL